ncbi:class I adenylate-forming enzyme family protein [Streptomyces canus]|uniref:class I adenylate-forming enzyme family protein n=1 Tax=Streptomyces canus TaxID=58343 RepID=UPI0032468493
MTMHAIHDLLLSARERRPDGTALRDDEGSWTYRELTAHTHGFGAWLRHRGIGPGDRVLIRAAGNRNTLAALYGCSLVGATAIPLSPTATRRELEHVVRDATPSLTLQDIPSVPAGEPSSADLDALSDPTARAAHPALLIYTSGSTAAPKAVVCRAEQILFAVTAIAERLRYAPDDVVYCRLPLSFDYGLYQTFLAAHATAELVVAPGGVDGRILTRIRELGATVVPLVPGLATILLRLARGRPVESSVRLFTNTGEALPAETIRELRACFPGAGIQLMYGTTECKRISIAPVDEDRERPGSVGPPLTGTRVGILGADGRETEAGEVGEVVVSGPHVMDGYWNAPEITAQVFRRPADGSSGETVLHTGDYGYLDTDGHVYVVGRRDSVFKRLGVRTSTAEIEAAARAVPGVTEAAVLPPLDGRDAALFVVASVPETEVLRQLRTLLDAQKVPGVCRTVGELPRQSNGKLDRVALRSLLTEVSP